MNPTNRNQQVLDVFRFRFACKKFDPAKLISKEDFETLLEAARLSPTSFGFEPWKLIVLTNPAIKHSLDPVAWGARNSLAGASHFVILLARKTPGMLHSSAFVSHMMMDIQQLPSDVAEQKRAKYRAFQESDFALLNSDRAMFDWACKQTYIVLANMMTAAAMLGIDSCPIEGFQRSEVDALLVKEGLFDSAQYGVSVMAGFGYRAEPPKHEKTRQPLSDLVLWK